MNAILEHKGVDAKLVKKFDIWIGNLGTDNVLGSEQRGERPLLIISNDKANTFGTTVTVAPLTTAKINRNMPTHVKLSAKDLDLECDSTVLVEQIRTIDKKRLGFKVAEMPEYFAEQVKRACRVQLDLF
ncbi:type II toxin-antitoxin system PemK/MazF family toxin [Paenibacillus sp. FSL M7-0802]|uniref:type II toxin-antitoxin system PemK/MazF family toxin n=1 Tax=Paenibacillus sp. FSL M7-0802 TaxID=2921536 RepID=UPI0030F5D1DE